jgi:hypothetical protein
VLASGTDAGVLFGPFREAIHMTARRSGLAWCYAATILVSAFLLFQVQPLISKAILPWFGGSPAVWTTCMLFFQAVLFAGYSYAHLSERALGRTARLVVHLGVLLAACLLLPITPDAAWKPEDSGEPTWRILGLLGVTVGLPYFVLSTTGPLVQAWFSRTFPGQSPYRLYSLSNAGSLTALLSYPFVFEPRWNVPAQGLMWSAGFVLFAVLCAVGAWQAWRMGEVPAAAGGEPCAPPPEVSRASTWRPALWVALPAFGSLTLLAATNHVCQDVAVIPFLWVVPLSLYLLSFIVCFDHERWYHRGAWGLFTAVLTLLAAGLHELPWDVPFVAELAVYFGAMFGVCMVCHGELVRLRPDPRHLTAFYLMISAGGALGGLFVSLIAPVVFDTFVEWRLALAGGGALAAGLLWLHARSNGVRIAWRVVAPGGAVAACGLVAVLNAGESGNRVISEVRNFYGETAVVERDPDEPLDHDYALFSGNTIHGVQFEHPSKRELPVTYYSHESGVGRVLRALAGKPDLRVGAVGLGCGTLAAYARPGHCYRFYEINPEMKRVAREHFTYLKDAEGTVEIVLGDARLSLERERPQHYDVLVLDAFSGDSVPAHLLTSEAFTVYQRHRAPRGVICVHITNHYLDLEPVVRGAALENGLHVVRVELPGDYDLQLYHSDWLILTDNDELLAGLRNGPTVPLNLAVEPVLWTDNASNLFEILK